MRILILINVLVLSGQLQASSYFRIACEEHSRITGRTGTILVLEQRYSSEFSPEEYKMHFEMAFGSDVPAQLRFYEATFEGLETVEEKTRLVDQLVKGEPQSDPIFGHMSWFGGDTEFASEENRKVRFASKVLSSPESSTFKTSDKSEDMRVFWCEPPQFIEVTVPDQAQQPNLESQNRGGSAPGTGTSI